MIAHQEKWKRRRFSGWRCGACFLWSDFILFHPVSIFAPDTAVFIHIILPQSWAAKICERQGCQTAKLQNGGVQQWLHNRVRKAENACHFGFAILAHSFSHFSVSIFVPGLHRCCPNLGQLKHANAMTFNKNLRRGGTKASACFLTRAGARETPPHPYGMAQTWTTPTSTIAIGA
jgi:hypothetical protein